MPNINRLFLAGHSGANQGLYESAQSKLVTEVPSDLILLDCFYRDGSAHVLDFGDKARGGLGIGPGHSRIILVHDPGSYGPGVDQFPVMRAALRKRYKDKVVEVTFKAGRTSAETRLNALAATRTALTQFPVVIVSGSLGHFSIPPDYLPLVLETAT